MPKINPFAPNSPVPPGLFVGRLDEIHRLEAALFQTRAEQASNFIIIGERGIGKSSLMSYLKFVAQGYIPIEGIKVKFLVVDTDIDQNTTQIGLIKKIELGLNKELGKTERARKFLSDVWGFIKRFEGAGFRLRPEQGVEQEEIVSEEFSYALAEIINRICNPGEDKSLFTATYDAILILIDEADNASKSLNLGSFFKLLMERLQRRSCNRVMVGLAGLHELRNVLIVSHPSSIRLFDEIVLDRLTNSEVSSVIDICLDKAKRDNSVPTSITDEARSFLISLSEGYPHFIQQFGYSSFATDTDNLIDRDDVSKGAFGPHGAMELIGDRYYRDKFYNKIQKESYRQVLRIMAENLDTWVSKEDIRKNFKGKESVLTNALKALRDRDIILSKEGERGVYRLQHKGFALWIKLYTMDPDQLQRALETAANGKGGNS